MYWTGRQGIIGKVGMDGSNPTIIKGGSSETNIIQIDFQRGRLYWASLDNNIIESSNLNGGDLQTIHQLSEGPWGLTILGERLYGGYWFSSTVQSSNIHTGADVRVEHVGSARTAHLTVPIWNPPGNRTNNCEGIVCSGVCVLTPTFYKCL